MGPGKRAARLLRCRWKYHQGRVSSYAHDRALERNTVPAEQRECAGGIPELPGIAGIPVLQFGFSGDTAGAISHTSAVQAGTSLDLFGRGVYRRTFGNWLLTSRRAVECCRRGDPRILDEFSRSSFSRPRRRGPCSRMDCRVDTKHSVRGNWSVFVVPSRLESRTPQL